MPERIQRKRTKGWRMPEGAVYVGRPSYWGNPFGPDEFSVVAITDGVPWDLQWRPWAVAEYRRWLEDPGDSGYARRVEAVIQLGGKDLACWCPLDQPCHADVLLEIANGPVVPNERME